MLEAEGKGAGSRGQGEQGADIINRANLGMEVMHERNAHNFPLDLAAGEVAPVALTAPAING
ncbi:photosystem II protein D1 [Anabaena sp. YBS01]|nr:photosystem II protein D1 [Anabaena sp. YBS01]